MYSLHQGIPGNDGVKVGAVVADKQHFGILGYLLYTAYMDTDAKQLHCRSCCAIQQKAIKGTILFVLFAWIDKQATYSKKKDVQQQ